jgi:hypothetical protein
MMVRASSHDSEVGSPEGTRKMYERSSSWLSSPGSIRGGEGGAASAADATAGVGDAGGWALGPRASASNPSAPAAAPRGKKPAPSQPFAFIRDRQR